MAKKAITVNASHIETLSRGKPIDALRELIWNSLDADASTIQVGLTTDDRLGGISNITISDNGTGIPHDEWDETFGDLGTTFKKKHPKTPSGRPMHGSKGKGRYRALSLGNSITWKTTYKKDKNSFSYTIKLLGHGSNEFDVDDAPAKMDAVQSGTIVSVGDINDSANHALSRNTLRSDLTQTYAIYLTNYKNIAIEINGMKLDAGSAIQRDDTIPLLDDADKEIGKLRVISWNFKSQNNKIIFCDEEWVPRHEDASPFRTTDDSFTAYLSSKIVHDIWESIELEKMNDAYRHLMRYAGKCLRQYFLEINSEKSAKLISEWKEQNLYPFSEDDENNPAIKPEKQLFDIVAARVHEYHEPLKTGSNSNKQFILEMLRQALENNPTHLTKILHEILKLPKDIQENLVELLDAVEFSKIINASKATMDRLATIQGIRGILFEKEWKKRLRERTQLHRILAKETWLFGEEYFTSGDDEPLRVVLEKHIAMLGRDSIAPERTPEQIDALEKIPDLMLSRRVCRREKDYLHLVVELKRPSLRLKDEEATQIRNYSRIVVNDEGFDKKNSEWKFILVGNNIDESLEDQRSQDDNHYGRIYNRERVSIWVYKWAEILDDAQARYQYFRDKLEFEITQERAIIQLREKYPELLSGKGLTKKQEEEKANRIDPKSKPDKKPRSTDKKGRKRKA